MTSRYRLLRSHDCPCGFRNEFEVAALDRGVVEPVVDMDELEVCPGCKSLVAVSRLLRLPVRALT